MTDYRHVLYQGKSVMYIWVKQANSKFLYAKVNKENDIIASSPNWIKPEKMDEFIIDNMPKFLEYISKRNDSAIININSPKVKIKGVEYEIQTKIDPQIKKEKYEIVNNIIFMQLRDELQKKKMLKRILFEHGDEYLISRAKQLAKKHSLQYNNISTKWYDTKWGQCVSADKDITLASQLITLSDDLIDYVILHELTHVLVADHSDKFWSTLAKYYPNYADAKEILKYEC